GIHSRTGALRPSVHHRFRFATRLLPVLMEVSHLMRCNLQGSQALEVGMQLSSLRSAELSLFACSALALAKGSGAQGTESHARVELVAEESAPRAGKPIWIGLLFHLDPGWHIYWQNPGDSGKPPKVYWELPSGWRAGAIRWP